MKVKRIILAGALAVLLGACATEQPVTDPVQNSGVTQGIEKEEKSELTLAPEATVTPEVTVLPTATEVPTATPEATIAPTATATPEATTAPTVAVEPEATTAPTVAVEPEATTAPIAATPTPTKPPAATATPKPTKAPVPTMSPKQKELATHLRTAHKDDVSAKIVEKGYWYEADKTCSDGIFTFDFKAVTGDMISPMLIIDVTVADETLVATYDKLKLYAYTLGEDVYDNELDQYGSCEGYGIRDEKVENLYHVTLPGTIAWMTNGESFVVDICRVDFEKKNANPDVYEVEVPEWRLTVPKYKLYPILEKGYGGRSFTYNGREYYLEIIDYGQYDTRISFLTYADRKEVLAMPGGAEQFTDSVWPEWRDFLNQLTLEVDGETFRVFDSGFREFSDYGGTEEDYKGGGTAWFSGINYIGASDVKLWLGTDGYDLKSDNKKMLHREPPAPVDEKVRKELSAHLRKYHKDEVSASIVEKGYYYTVDESRTADIFRFDLKAITGDMLNSKMVFDVIVEDDVLAEMYNTIHLYVGCVTEDRYDPEDEYGWNRVGYGIRDEENKNVYHVTMDGAMLGYGPTIIDIYRIGFDFDKDYSNGALWYEVEPEVYRVDVPRTEFHPAYTGQYEGMTFIHGGREYEIRVADFGMYQTQIGLYTYIDAKEVPADEYELQDYRNELQKEWLDFAKTLRVVVDGKEYKVIDEEDKRGYVWFSVEEGETSYMANAYPYFPAIDYIKADMIEVKTGDTVHRLK